MANLPIYQAQDPIMMQMQTVWKANITPTINNALNQGQLLTGIALVAGSNTINHLLSRTQVGYIIVDQDAAASVYRSKPLNSTTLTLTSDNPCNVAIWVF